MSQFVAQGYLVKVKHFVGITPDLSVIKVKMNDYAQDELGELIQDTELMADLVNANLYQPIISLMSTYPMWGGV